MKELGAVTLRELAEALGLGNAAHASEWTDLASPESPVPHRLALEAGKRGELAVHRIGQRRLVRTSELNEWIARQPTIADAKREEPSRPQSAASLTLARNGWRAAG